MNLESNIKNHFQFETIFEENDENYLKILDGEQKIQKIAASRLQTEHQCIKIQSQNADQWSYINLDELIDKLHLSVDSEVVNDLREGKTETLEKAHLDSLALLTTQLLIEASKVQELARKQKMILAFNEQTLSELLIEKGINASQAFSHLIKKFTDEQAEKRRLEEKLKGLNQPISLRIRELKIFTSKLSNKLWDTIRKKKVKLEELSDIRNILKIGRIFIDIKPQHLPVIQETLINRYKAPQELAEMTCKMLNPDRALRLSASGALSLLEEFLPRISPVAYQKIVDKGWIL